MVVKTEIVNVANVYTKGSDYIQFFIKEKDILKYKKIKRKTYELCKELSKILGDR